jgi:hypothetical protein
MTRNYEQTRERLIGLVWNCIEKPDLATPPVKKQVSDRVWSDVGLQVWHDVWLPVRDQVREEHNG